jgi:hypothetical protein
VFIDMSTPVIVPFMTLPFLSSIVTLSLLSFIKKRTSFMIAVLAELVFPGRRVAKLPAEIFFYHTLLKYLFQTGPGIINLRSQANNSTINIAKCLFFRQLAFLSFF